jgi:2-amino-4-hydroxy-6-hydroxymethyldihydropteridine diphosphokinase
MSSEIVQGKNSDYKNMIAEDMEIDGEMHLACLLLGSNIEPEVNIARAITLLRDIFPTVRLSSIWETPPVGSPGPSFLNVAVLVETALDASQLKARVLRRIETQLGRLRSADKFAPRTIDIDIITWDADVLDNNLWKYAHLAVPVAELLPCFQSGETGEYLEQVAERLAHLTPIKARPEVFAEAGFTAR